MGLAFRISFCDATTTEQKRDATLPRESRGEAWRRHSGSVVRAKSLGNYIRIASQVHDIF
jgi:hypothetical protein